MLRTIERHQLLFISVAALVFCLGAWFGPYPPRYQAVSVFSLDETHPGLLWEAKHRTPADPVRSDSGEAARTPLEYDLAALRSRTFRKQVAQQLSLPWQQVAFTIRPIDDAGRVQISANYPDRKQAVAVVDAVSAAWQRNSQVLVNSALLKQRDFLRQELERVKALPPPRDDEFSCGGGGDSEPVSLAYFFQELEAQVSQQIVNLSGTALPVCTVRQSHNPAVITALWGLLAVWLAAAAVAIADRRR